MFKLLLKTKTVFSTILFVTLALVLSVPAHAAAPDGAGPWADSVVHFAQGQTKAGGAVPAPRSIATSALGVAEDDNIEPHFVSLGFGGVLTLGFDNLFNTAVVVVETTNAGYPVETASVEVSANGTTWVSAGSVSQDGQVNVPSSVGCAKYVRLTDTSVKANFTDDTADGYDVDGVRVTGETCVPPVTPTPTPPCDNTPECGCGTTNINISGNGNGSTNGVVVTNTNTKSVTQTNNTNVVIGANVVAKTGNNKANKNVGGANTITTGKAKAKVEVKVKGGTNKIGN